MVQMHKNKYADKTDAAKSRRGFHQTVKAHDRQHQEWRDWCHQQSRCYYGGKKK